MLVNETTKYLFMFENSILLRTSNRTFFIVKFVSHNKVCWCDCLLEMREIFFITNILLLTCQIFFITNITPLCGDPQEGIFCNTRNIFNISDFSTFLISLTFQPIFELF